MRPPSAVSFVAFGVPKPEGSTNSIGFIRKKGPKAGKPGVHTTHSKTTATWRQTLDQVLQDLTRERGPMELLDGPLVASARFYFDRPKSHPKTRRTWPVGYPDVSKLARCIEDALIGVIIRDDSRIVRYDALEKDYACYTQDPRPRAEVSIWRLEEISYQPVPPHGARPGGGTRELDKGAPAKAPMEGAAVSAIQEALAV